MQNSKLHCNEYSTLPVIVDILSDSGIYYDISQENESDASNWHNKLLTVGFFSLIFGFAGMIIAWLFQYWTLSIDYRINTGSMEFFALPPSLPAIFEFTILMAAAGAFFGFLITGRLPDWSDDKIKNKKKGISPGFEFLIPDLKENQKIFLLKQFESKGIQVYLTDI